jgi:hypothetical protein
MASRSFGFYYFDESRNFGALISFCLMSSTHFAIAKAK